MSSSDVDAALAEEQRRALLRGGIAAPQQSAGHPGRHRGASDPASQCRATHEGCESAFAPTATVGVGSIYGLEHSLRWWCRGHLEEVRSRA